MTRAHSTRHGKGARSTRSEQGTPGAGGTQHGQPGTARARGTGRKQVTRREHGRRRGGRARSMDREAQEMGTEPGIPETKEHRTRTTRTRHGPQNKRHAPKPPPRRSTAEAGPAGDSKCEGRQRRARTSARRVQRQAEAMPGPRDKAATQRPGHSSPTPGTRQHRSDERSAGTARTRPPKPSKRPPSHQQSPLLSALGVSCWP